MDLIFERGAKRRVKCPEALTESWPADVRSELRQILPMHIILSGRNIQAVLAVHHDDEMT